LVVKKSKLPPPPVDEIEPEEIGLEKEEETVDLTPDAEVIGFLRMAHVVNEPDTETVTPEVIKQDSELTLKLEHFIFDTMYQLKKGNLTAGLAVNISLLDTMFHYYYNHKGFCFLDLVNFKGPFEKRRLSVDGYLLNTGLKYAYAVNGMNPENAGLPGTNINFSPQQQPPVQSK